MKSLTLRFGVLAIPLILIGRATGRAIDPDALDPYSGATEDNPGPLLHVRRNELGIPVMHLNQTVRAIMRRSLSKREQLRTDIGPTQEEMDHLVSKFEYICSRNPASDRSPELSTNKQFYSGLTIFGTKIEAVTAVAGLHGWTHNGYISFGDKSIIGHQGDDCTPVACIMPDKKSGIEICPVGAMKDVQTVAFSLSALEFILRGAVDACTDVRGTSPLYPFHIRGKDKNDAFGKMAIHYKVIDDKIGCEHWVTDVCASKWDQDRVTCITGKSKLGIPWNQKPIGQGNPPPTKTQPKI